MSQVEVKVTGQCQWLELEWGWGVRHGAAEAESSACWRGVRSVWPRFSIEGRVPCLTKKPYLHSSLFCVNGRNAVWMPPASAILLETGVGLSQY